MIRSSLAVRTNQRAPVLGAGSGAFEVRPELKSSSKKYPTVSLIRSSARTLECHHGPARRRGGVQETTPTLQVGAKTLAKMRRLRRAWGPRVKTLMLEGRMP